MRRFAYLLIAIAFLVGAASPARAADAAAEIRASYGLDVAEAEVEMLRDCLDDLRQAIKRTPAMTIFGVGVRLVVVAHSSWEDDHRETFFSTLATVEKLSGATFNLPTLRV